MQSLCSPCVPFARRVRPRTAVRAVCRVGSSAARVPLSELGGVDAVFHTVVSGETVRGIAQAYRSSPAQLQRLNPGLSAGSPQPGTRLLVAAPPSVRQTSSYALGGLTATSGRGEGTAAADAVTALAAALAVALALAALLSTRRREAGPGRAGGSPVSGGAGGEAGGEAGAGTQGVSTRRAQRFSWGGRVGTEDLAAAAEQPGGAAQAPVAPPRSAEESPALKTARAAAAAEVLDALARRRAQPRGNAAEANKLADAERESRAALARVDAVARAASRPNSTVPASPPPAPPRTLTVSDEFRSPAAMTPQQRAETLAAARAWAASGRPAELGMTGAAAATTGQDDLHQPWRIAEEEALAAASKSSESAAVVDVAARVRADVERDRVAAPAADPMAAASNAQAVACARRVGASAPASLRASRVAQARSARPMGPRDAASAAAAARAAAMDAAMLALTVAAEAKEVEEARIEAALEDVQARADDAARWVAAWRVRVVAEAEEELLEARRDALLEAQRQLEEATQADAARAAAEAEAARRQQVEDETAQAAQAAQAALAAVAEGAAPSTASVEPPSAALAAARARQEAQYSAVRGAQMLRAAQPQAAPSGAADDRVERALGAVRAHAHDELLEARRVAHQARGLATQARREAAEADARAPGSAQAEEGLRRAAVLALEATSLEMLADLVAERRDLEAQARS